MNDKDKIYDFVYLTNTPSFYKLNLCNRIAETNSILLVLYGYGNEAVNTVLKDHAETKFDYVFLSEGDSNRRNKVTVFVKLLRLMRKVKCRKVLYAGWMAPEYNLYSFLSPKRKNVMVCESSEFDVSFSGIAGWIKRAVINRMGVALPSGIPHKQLFDNLGFKGQVKVTGSVGIFHGMKSIFLQNEYGQIAPVYSISAGLDYPGIGPEHANLWKTWADRGLLTVCDGVRVDYSDVTAWFCQMRDEYKIDTYKVGYDRALAGYWVDEMTSNGFEMVAVAQGPFTWSQPMREMGAAFADKKVNYNKNPVLLWCLTNTAVKKSGVNNIQPVKISDKRRIDGAVSLLNAWVIYVRDFEDYMYLVG